MTRVGIRGDEWYPVYVPFENPTVDDQVQFTFDIPADQLERWQGAIALFNLAQQEMRDLVDPPCADCTHRKSRHQKGELVYDRYVGCLEWLTDENGIRAKRCRCPEWRD